MIIKLEILQDIATGHITAIMTTHAVGYSNDKLILMIERYLSHIIIIANKMIIHKYHILILSSYTSHPTGRCDIIYNHHLSN